MRCAIEPLTFTLLDDISYGLQSKVIDEGNLPPVTAAGLGPLIELRQTGLLNGKTNWFNAGRHANLLRGIANGGMWFDPAKHQGYVSVVETEADDLKRIEFEMRAKRAARDVGFAQDEAGELVAAMGELRTNILEHSQYEETGYLVFDATPNRFEFAVADAGIGALGSLRLHPHYDNVKDAGTALELVLSEGVSRFYEEKDRGKGFRPIFIGLANASRHLRFRSGDHSREIVRDDERGQLQAATHQRAHLQGFTCCAVCEVS